MPQMVQLSLWLRKRTTLAWNCFKDFSFTCSKNSLSFWQSFFLLRKILCFRFQDCLFSNFKLHFGAVPTLYVPSQIKLVDLWRKLYFSQILSLHNSIDWSAIQDQLKMENLGMSDFLSSSFSKSKDRSWSLSAPRPLPWSASLANRDWFLTKTLTLKCCFVCGLASDSRLRLPTSRMTTSTLTTFASKRFLSSVCLRRGWSRRRRSRRFSCLPTTPEICFTHW